MGERTIIKNGKNNTELTNKEKRIKKIFNQYYYTNTPKPKPTQKRKSKPVSTQKNEKKTWEQKLKNAKTKQDLRKIFIQASKELHPNKGGTSTNFNKMFKLYTNLSQRI